MQMSYKVKTDRNRIHTLGSADFQRLNREADTEDYHMPRHPE